MSREGFLEAPFYSGHLACSGCGERISHKLALQALGERTVLVIPACCATVVDGPFPHSTSKIPLMHTAFETTAAVAAGIRAAYDALGKKDITVMGWAGDGGTFDIGIQALSAAAERNENILYVCYDNEAYMNTGIQRSSATPWGAWTTTTPVPKTKDVPKKNLIEIVAAHRVPYIATATAAFPDDFSAKFKKAKNVIGFRFIHLLSPCPPGWKFSSEMTITMARLAVETKIFPLLEIEDGERYTINYRPKGLAVEEYLKLQGRFKHLTKEQVAIIQNFVDRNWQRLLYLSELGEEIAVSPRSAEASSPVGDS